MGPGLILPGASAWWMRSSTWRDFWSPSTSIALQEQPFLRWGPCPAARNLWGGSVLQGLDENPCQDTPGCIPVGFAGLCPLGRTHSAGLQGEKSTGELTQHLPALTTNRMDLARASQSSSPEPLLPKLNTSRCSQHPATLHPLPTQEVFPEVFCPGTAPAAPDPHLSSSTSPASRGLAGEHEIWLELGCIRGDQPVRRAGGSQGLKLRMQTSPGGPHQTSSSGFL